ncbi:MAG: filamentous hemagglutinin N-terminal domain-containing protein [Proteobacteria bacterium]|uniref:two-partner secretion domain-containing protein n=1 Tax=Aquabacterium sp. TaxID=1872578 RepID=UPI0035C6C44E|nr:filamentous hemagglutinin N-terminal domain-containing protein [Pseudomonadota bacterium]
MNKHVHRLVFDRRRGMRVPAAEHARSAGKAGGGQTRAVAVAGAVSMLIGSVAQAQSQMVSAGAVSSAMGATRLSTSALPARAFSPSRSVSDMVSQVLASGRPNLPVLSATYAGENKGLFEVKDPTQTDAYLMRVLQQSGAIVVNWDSFDIGKGYTVRFEQPTGGRALNKVRGASPSLIDGALQGNGEVMIENGAGIIFGKNARVNTGSLVATALSIAQNAMGNLTDMNDAKALNLYQWRDGRAVFGGDEAQTAGFVATEPGAVIQSLSGGRVIMVAPRVVNKGLIESPSGQTILAAGKTVYLYAPTDTAQRGLLVAVDNFTDATLDGIKADVVTAQAHGETGLNTDATPLGTVENVREGGAYTSGLVRADKGTINLVGAAIRQKGQLTATTAVKAQNGGIFLQAMKDTFDDGGVRKAKTLGSVELGAGSLTEVLPSSDGLVSADGKTVASQQVVGVVQGDGQTSTVVLNKIGVNPDEVLRVPASLAEPTRPTVPAEDATDAVKAKYQADLAKYLSDKAAYDLAELSVQTSGNTFYRSRIDILGNDITLRSGSRVQAPGGEINILAAKDWQDSPLRLGDNTGAVKDGSRILMEAGAVVDASGLDNLLLPAQRSQLKAQLFSIELADSPLQRAGVVYRQTVMADARGLVSLGDTSGYYSNLRYTAAEMSTSGGLVRMLSQGALMLDPDARVDFSGGSVTYDAGALVSSVLVRNGLITLANDARRDVVYDAFISDPSRTSADDLVRFGLGGLNLPAPSVLPGQFVGKSAGAAVLGAPVASLGAVLDGSVRMSEAQRSSAQEAGRDPGLNSMLQAKDASSSPVWAGLDDLRANDRTVRLSQLLTKEDGEAASGYQPHLFASLRPTAGLLVVGHEIGTESASKALASLVSSVSITGQSLSAPRISADMGSEAWAQLLAQVGTTTTLSTSQLQRGGLAGVSLLADRVQYGQAATQDAPSLQLAAGGSFQAKAREGDVVVNGGITVPGGSIGVTAQAGDVILTSGSRLDAAGTRRDDRVVGSQSPAPALKGGSVSLTAFGDIELAQGSAVDVSGTAWRGTNGSLIKGRAGTVSLKVNSGASAAGGAMPEGELTLAGTLSGFDFSGGGTLKLDGLSSVVLGGTRDGAFSLSTGLYADRGFGNLQVTSLGDVDVLAGTQVRPVLVNMQSLSSAYSYLTGATYALTTLETGLRNGTRLTLKASTEPAAAGEARNGFAAGEGANVRIGKGAVIDTGLGGGITLQAGGSIDMAGTLRALAGDVSLSISGERGVRNNTEFEDYGYVAGQAIHLRDESLIDVSGAVKAVEKRSVMTKLLGLRHPLVGEVLAGGTVTLGGEDGEAVRGQLLMDAGATIRLNGASGFLSRELTTPASRISAAAGTLNIMSTDGFSLLGKVEAKAPDASVAGGTIHIALSREGTIDNVQSTGQAYPSGAQAGKRSIRITDTQASAKQLSNNGRLFGEGVVSAELLNNSGFDQVQLRADDTIQLNAGVSLKAAENRTRLQSVVLDAPVVELTNKLKTTVTQTPEFTITVVADEVASGAAKTAADHVIQAHHVAMGPVTSKGGTTDTVAASQRTLSGDRWLDVQAGLIEVNGDTAVQGAKRVDLQATLGRTAATSLNRQNGEIRFIGQSPLTASLTGDRTMHGKFSFQGELNLTAGQVYATTLSNFAVLGTSGSTLNVLAPAAGSTSQTPLSALATLKLQATNVNLDGVIRQPVGSIEVTADKLTLGDRAALSISADGVTVPVGMTVNNSKWVYSSQGQVTGDVPDTDNVVQDITNLPITKQILLNGKTLSLSASSTVEAQAGGDIAAWQFNAGVGGTTDTYLREGVFAVLPSYGYDFAPYDSDIRARTKQIGTDLKAGDQVTITTGNKVLAAGTYTLLDARYGILPGAVLVSSTSLNVKRSIPVALKNDDGSVIVSGYRTSTGTAQNGGNDQRQALVLEPESAFRAKSDITVVSGNEFQRERAAKDGVTLALPGDGGRVSLSADAAFNWQARFNFKGKDGLKAGEFDLAMPDIEVRSALPQVATAAGVVGLDQLNALGADSVLLGGVRTTLSDGSVSVTRKASSVAFVGDAEGSTLSTSGELMAVATRSVTVDPGMTIASTGKDDGASRSYKVQGDGALLQVGQRAATDITVTGATVGNPATLSVGSDQTGAKSVVLSGASVQLDSTGTTKLADSTVLNAQSLGLGAGSMVVGDAAAAPADALQVKGDLLNRLNQAERLALRASAGSMAFAGGTQLGGAGTKQLTLDAPQLLGVATKDATAEAAAQAVTTVKAQELVLRNSSGLAADGQAGVGQLALQATPKSTDGHTGGITVAASGTAGQRLGFARTMLNSQGDIVFSGQGSTQAQGDVTLSAARVTAASDAKQQLTAQGDLTVQRATGGHTLNESLGAGGKLGLEARTIQQQGNIDIEAGRLNLVARGDNGAPAEALVFAAGSNTSVAGRLRQVSDTYAVASGGGQLTAEARQGAIVVDGTLSAAAPTIPSGVTGDAPAAGSISLKATGANGQVLLGQQARLDVSGAAGQSGTVAVDTRQLALTQAAATAAAANAAQAQNGLDQLAVASRNADGSALREFNVRQRDGNLSLNEQVKAAMVALTADTGGLALGSQARIDATTAAGGVVQLQSQGDLTLNDGAHIEARSTRDGANGGDVLLASSQGTIQLGAATVVADSEGDDKDGRIVLRARQTQTAQGAYTGGMNVERISGSAPATLQAGRVQLDGVRVYDDTTKTSLVSGATTTTAWGMTGTDGLQTHATDFASSANQTAILAKAGLSGTANAGVRAEAEIVARSATGSFAVGTTAQDIQMAAAPGTAGNQPMNLTVRAAGDLNVNGSVSSGLSGATTSATVQAGEGASLRFVAGADLTSANVNATQADASKGHFTLASNKLIRTTTGSIDVHASGDVRLMAATTTTPSSIYVTGGLSSLAATEVFAVANTSQSINAATGATGAYPTASSVFTERGERLTVFAGAEVGSFESVSFDNGKEKKVRQQLLQGTGNYFVHGGALGSSQVSANVPVAWFSRFNDFRQGFGSFGGGNVSITAGTDISNLAVVAPTSARSVLNVDASGNVQSSSLKVLNGGDVTVSAGGDIRGGLYFLGRGEGRLSAGGSLLAGDDRQVPNTTPVSGKLVAPGAMLGVMDGHWSVSAVDDLTVSHIFNPTAIPFLASTASTGLTNTRASVYYTYAADAGASLSSLKRNVTLAPDSENFKLLLTTFSPVQKLIETNSAPRGTQAAQLALVLPPNLSLVSLGGDVRIDGSGRYVQGATAATNSSGGAQLYVAPSAQSDVNVYAANDVVMQAKLQLLDANQVSAGGLPSVNAPTTFTAVGISRPLATLTTELSASDPAKSPGLIPYAFQSDASQESILTQKPIADLGQAQNQNVVRLYAGRDVVFSDVIDSLTSASGNELKREAFSYLRTPRPTEIVAGRDIVNPNFLGQNFDEADVTRLSAGRDITGIQVARSDNPRTVALGGPGALVLEAGRDIELGQMNGVVALGNAVNSALPAASAKITVAAGVAKTVNIGELQSRYGNQAGLRDAVNQALTDSGLLPSGGSWASLSDSDAFAAFGQLSEARQVEAVQTFQNATFAALYLPEDAGKSPAYYRSTAFQRKKQEAMWAQIQQAAAAANAIAVSTDATEEASRKLRRQALFAVAEAVADLAGHGRTFRSEGDVNVGQSRVHNLGQGGGTALGRADDSLGGIDVLASGQIVAGLPTAAGAPGGFINFLGGSFRSLSQGDFLAGDQKVISLGRGNLLIYSVHGSIDSGKGSNTSVAADVPSRVFNVLTGLVESKGNPPTSGSGFQKVQTPSDMTPVIGLYAPNGEIRALDAFIKGDANISIVAPTVKGGDNIGGASGVAAPPAPTVSISLTPKVADTAAGVTQVAQASDNKSKQASNSVMTVDLLGFGDQGAATAAGDANSKRELDEKRDR